MEKVQIYSFAVFLGNNKPIVAQHELRKIENKIKQVVGNDAQVYFRTSEFKEPCKTKKPITWEFKLKNIFKL